MKKLFKFLVFSIIILSIFAATVGYQYHDFLRRPLAVSKEGTVFVIPMGTPVYKIANNLAEAGVLKSSSLFLLSAYTNGCWDKLKAGEYLIKPGSTPVDLINQLRDGKVIQYALTIVPGWTFERLMLEITCAPKIQQSLTGLSPAEIMAKLGHAAEHPEGRFFPETYYYPAGITDIAILQRAYRDLQTKLSLLWNAKKRDSILKSAYNALILASIIEKESSVVDEYRDIAGVYTRRLAKNMPLQADPTVIYGAGKTYDGLKYNSNITREMLTQQNPYNTYLKVGLPPTPIALPSAKALEAALDPKAGETLYFVAKPDGKGHVFTENLTDHNSAVAEYRKRLVNIKSIP
ncbi:MAG TPA: endolytic transglycosylase MltG [Gammaproteobacteria bacterium]|nr:endolytic transglycosylase MltG [Gammaproteobacteria bacterium]